MSELYANAVCLAPMVRSNTLPLRLVSLRYGADLVYGEEVVDKAIISATRVRNGALGRHYERFVQEHKLLDTVDFASIKGGAVVFRTCSEERRKVVFQIGTADAVLALRGAEIVAGDVAAVDINMGCPKHFSIQGGMGAALLKKPEIACDILKTLRRNLNIPVSCKIRILEDAAATIDLAKRFEQAGAVAIGLHGRQVHERPVDRAHWDAFAPVVSALSVPVLVNGDIFSREDLASVRATSGARSFLIARGALANASIFRREGMLPYTDVVVDYLKVAAETDNVYHNTKYNVARMIPTRCSGPSSSAAATVAELHGASDDRQMFALWGLGDFYDQTRERFRTRAQTLGLGLPLGAGVVSTAAIQTQNSQPRVARAYDDAFVASQQFYCNACHVQLANDAEVVLHTSGKKHRRRVRDAGAFAQ